MLTYLESVGKSVTVARLLRNEIADRTLGAWPQSILALAEKMRVMALAVLQCAIGHRSSSKHSFAANCGGSRTEPLPDLEIRT